MSDETPQQQKRNVDIRADVDINAGTVSDNASVVGFNIGNVTADVVHIHEAPLPVVVLTPQERRNRAVMLDKVEAFWVRGVLDQPIYQLARIELGLKDIAHVVANPWERIVQRPERPDRLLSEKTPIITVFDDLQGAMLIMGSPGAGKTTLLLELARDLIVRARKDEQHPLPVVFNLATWAVKKPRLKEWLVEELRLRYSTPPHVGRRWIKSGSILPLLDGLDEVADEHRNDCVEAINSFRQDDTMVPVVVCCRTDDYASLDHKLVLSGAVAVQPLHPETLHAYLQEMGASMERIRALLHVDPTLVEIIDSPLMLTVLAISSEHTSVQDIVETATVEERRIRLWDHYINAMLKRRSYNPRWSKKATIRYLATVAHEMQQYSTTTYSFRNLPYDSTLSAPSLASFIAFSSVFGFLGGIAAFAFGAPLVVLGVMVGIAVGTGINYGINVMNRLHFSLLGCLIRIVLGSLGRDIGVVWGALNALLLSALAIGPICAFFHLISNGIISAVIALLLGTLIGGLSAGLLFLLVFPLLYSLRGTLLRHLYYLNMTRRGVLPLHRNAFLNYSVERIFLRRIGGEYMFIHRLLLDHFAHIYTRLHPNNDHKEVDAPGAIVAPTVRSETLDGD